MVTRELDCLKRNEDCILPRRVMAQNRMDADAGELKAVFGSGVIVESSDGDAGVGGFR